MNKQMKKGIRIQTLLMLGMMPFCSLQARESALHVDSIIAELGKPDSDQVLVIAHRGDWRNHPENSIAAVKSCIQMGVDIVELDVRKTKDGVFVLLHDGTVNRTTNGKGKIGQMTLEQVKELRLKHKGKVTDQQVPTLKEVLAVAKGSIMINVDKAGVSKELLKVINEAGVADHILFKSGASAEKIKAVLEASPSSKNIHFMPVLRKGGMPEIEKYMDLPTKPKAVELIFSKADSPFNDGKLVRACRAKGLRTWVNTLWPSLCAGQNDAKAVKDPDAIWGGLINKGYNMIQTDNPKELIDYLRSKKLHRADDRLPKIKSAQ